MRHDHLARLLEDGALVERPGPEIEAAAHCLESLGLIGVERAEFVRYADSADGDFAWSNRVCPGQVVLPADYEDEDLPCPVCGRLVFPETNAKRRHRQLRVRVKLDGVVAYLRSLLADDLGEPEEIAAGVLRVPVGTMGVYVCVVDACRDPRFLGRDWARTQPTCYVVVAPRLARRFLEEEWIRRVKLSNIVAGENDLVAVVMEVGEAGSPTVVRNASVPVCATGVPPIVEGDRHTPQSDRCFVVQVTGDRVFIEGEPVMAAQADTRYVVFRLFWERFLDDLREGRVPEQYRVMDLPSIMKELADRMGRQLVDEMSIRRTINRLQADIMTTLRRKRGLPVGREDIIETCRWAGQGKREYGYRLNPLKVAVRPGHVCAEDRQPHSEIGMRTL